MSGNRKDDHLRLAEGQQRAAERPRSDFDDVRIVHHALAGVSAAAVSLETAFDETTVWPLPFYINGMTGGSELTGRVNAQLAEAAAATGVPIATGSMSVFLRDPEALPTYRVLRERNPDGFVMANLGADATPSDAARVIDALGADALQLHVNAVQETVMPEGSREFGAWSDKIAAVIDAARVPVIVKEVGFGMTRETIARLRELGAKHVDVSGRGGTNFALIENARRDAEDYAFLADFGQSAPFSLIDAHTVGGPAELPVLFASGGVRHPLDVVRALALGARATGVAGEFLKVALDRGSEGLIEVIEGWRARLVELLALVGASRPCDLTGVDVLVTGALAEQTSLRGADLAELASRSSRKQGRMGA